MRNRQGHVKKCSYCGRLSDDSLTDCRECGTPLPSQPFVPGPAHPPTTEERAARRRTFLDGLVWTALALGIFAAGWLYPVAATSHTDLDDRTVPGVLFAFMGGLAFGALAVRCFYRALTSRPSGE